MVLRFRCAAAAAFGGAVDWTMGLSGNVANCSAPSRRLRGANVEAALCYSTTPAGFPLVRQ